MSAPRRVDPDVSVVIPTLGRPILGRCLDSLAAGSVAPAAVVVVDQGETDAVVTAAAAARAAGLNVEHVRSAASGRAAGVNLGVARVRTPFVAVTDDDCTVAPDWLERLAARLRQAPHAILTGRVDAGGDEPVASVVRSMRPVVQRRPSLRFDRLSGGNMGAAVAVLSKLGPLDEDPCLRTAEDAEFAYRALRAGTPIHYAPDIAVTHLGWRDAAARRRQYADYARSHGGFLGKYLRRGDLFMALRAVLHWLRALRRWIWGRATGREEAAAMAGAYVRGLPAGILAGWRSAAR